MIIGNKTFDVLNQTYIMGILNVTPDSFSDGGRYLEKDAALFHGEKLVRDGADILDIGGESTRPGHTPVGAAEEAERVVPIIEAVKREFDIPVSVDTYKAEVALQAATAGADLINDIWGLKGDRQMASVIAQTKTACCLMHNRKEPIYDNFMDELMKDLADSVRLAKEAGIDEEKIILDPGIGFGKTYEMNLTAMNHLERLKDLEYPVLLGASRKSVIGLTLDMPAEQRLEGTLATTVLAVMKGCAFVRVHDVEENNRAIQMIQAILKERKVYG